MTSQPSLLGEADAVPRERLFFALMPDPATAAAIAALAVPLQTSCAPGGRLLPAARLHVTLHHLGDFPRLPPDLLAAARQAAAQVAMAPFDIAFDTAGSFAGHRQHPFVLRAEGPAAAGVCALHAALAQAMARRGLRGDTRFTPHLTLAYGHARVPWQALAARVGWRADAFVLVRSHLGQGRYDIEGRWPLAAP